MNFPDFCFSIKFVLCACVCIFCHSNLIPSKLFGKEVVVYVSPSGTASGDGSHSLPLADPTQARDWVRNKRDTGEISKDDSVTILLMPGRYFLKEGFRLEKRDSGTSETAPLRIRSEKPFAAEWIGGSAIPVSAFKKPIEPSGLERLDVSVRDKILCADLNELQLPIMPDWGDAFTGRPTSAPELFFNDEPMTVARWPNQGWAGFKTAIDSGQPHNEETATILKTVTEKRGIRFEHPDTDTSKPHGGAFLYDEEGLSLRDPDRFKRWKTAPGVWLCGYWTHDWSDQILRVAEIDTENKILTFKKPHHYGIGLHSWTGYAERRYFVLNVLEELDMPGEWYLDRQKNLLYFYPPENLKESDSILLSTLSSFLVETKDAEHIQFEGLTIGPTFGGAVRFSGGTKNAVLGCRIKNTGHTGIEFLGGSAHRVQSCDLYQLGSTGVVIHGGDRKTLTPGRHEAVNNHLHHFGRWQRTYAGAFLLQGVGNLVQNNRIHDAPHLAILYGGNENQIIRNEIFNVVLETSDAGALYTGRDWTTQGNRIEENFIHHLGTSDTHGTMGVYLDDCDSGDIIRRNCFYKASRAIFIGGGRDNIAENNLIVDCYQGIALDSRGMSWKQWNSPDDASWQLLRKAEELNYRNPPWSERYPNLANIMENEPKMPLGCVFRKNVMIDCMQWMHLDGNVLNILKRTDLAYPILVQNNLVVENKIETANANLPEKEQQTQRFEKNTDPGFVDPNVNNFRFKEDSDLKNILPDGFEPIPWDRIGIYVDPYRPALE